MSPSSKRELQANTASVTGLHKALDLGDPIPDLPGLRPTLVPAWSHPPLLGPFNNPYFDSVNPDDHPDDATDPDGFSGAAKKKRPAPIDSERVAKRRDVNTETQRSFRERQAHYIVALEHRVALSSLPVPQQVVHYKKMVTEALELNARLRRAAQGLGGVVQAQTLAETVQARCSLSLGDLFSDDEDLNALREETQAWRPSREERGESPDYSYSDGSSPATPSSDARASPETFPRPLHEPQQTQVPVTRTSGSGVAHGSAVHRGAEQYVTSSETLVATFGPEGSMWAPYSGPPDVPFDPSRPLPPDYTLPSLPPPCVGEGHGPRNLYPHMLSLPQLCSLPPPQTVDSPWVLEVSRRISARFVVARVRANMVRHLLGRHDLLPVVVTSSPDHHLPLVAPLTRADLPTYILLDADRSIAPDTPVDDGASYNARLIALAGQIGQHIDRYRSDPSYRMPEVLRPTELQHLQQHDLAIDMLPFPALRDQLILHQHRINVDVVLSQLLSHLRYHTSDLSDPDCFELPLAFFLRYPFLLNEPLLAHLNRWRNTRGLPAFPTLRDLHALAPPASAYAAAVA